MLTDAQREHLGVVTRTLQIIIAAMALGVLMFAGIAIFISPAIIGAKGAPEFPFLTFVAAGAAFVALVVSWIVPGILAANHRQAMAAGKPVAASMKTELPAAAEDLGDVRAMATAIQTQRIVRAAILEGAAFFCLVAYLVEKQPLSLVATGVLTVFLLGPFPTRSRVEDWVEGELATIEQFRQMRTVDAR